MYERCEKLRPVLFRLASDATDDDAALGNTSCSARGAPGGGWAMPRAPPRGREPGRVGVGFHGVRLGKRVVARVDLKLISRRI